jgi:large subunit ribosomal protein L19
MKKKIIEFNSTQREKKIPDLRSGDIVKITRKIKEGGKEISQVFEGIIIAIKGKQSSSPTMTVRKVSHGVGTELILPIFSPNIGKIVLVKRAKVRRAKLYFIREKSTKSLKLKYKNLSEFAKVEPTDDKAMANEGSIEEKPAEEKKETENK